MQISHMQESPVADDPHADIRGERVHWRCDGHELSLGVDRAGTGPTVLLLPALSSISTRAEMQPLQQRLADAFSTVALDWPGFGDLPRPQVDWRPEIYRAFLSHVLAQVVPRPFAIIAAGHATGYVLEHCAQHPRCAQRLVLLSPTWRGPLPTMMNGDRPLFGTLARLFDPPMVGPVLYGLNVNRWVVGLMGRGHVYADPNWLHGEHMAQKMRVTRAPGARHASARFVTGALDPFRSRAAQHAAAANIPTPVLNVFSENAPRKSRAEMEALAALPNVTTVRVAKGKLSFYEEFPSEVYAALRGFLGR